ncbi:serine/threonine-protein kinase [Rubripirellula reticaptiva]|uniref:Serine/threonine-protein kinase PrkC n=1 Tax=Rubripirellula reticaptiva TaxID=2528013 RepID=A0A5C6EH78_9BACT|nr:serine/threonine-protein kinase [Rubripirellula reticaptiva]TWU48352.1 Serine/threonine-protein kinase PrkC [Rubripirellula reticaptiva]
MVALNQSVIDISNSEPSLLHGLTKDQQTRLTDLLDLYLRSLEDGQRLDAEQLTQANPDLADVFNAYLEKLDALYGVAVGFQGPAQTEASVLSGSMTLGEFTIHREIGRGGMGVVYEASQKSLDRRVAIKLLPLASLLDSRQIARFKNEAHAAGLLQHPNIVPIHSVGSERGVHYYAMQFIEGISMDAWCAGQRREANGLQNGRAQSWEDVIGWSIDIAGALQVAHENGVVHRDVKPSNLMLDTAGKIWITDFGLARCQTDVSLTRSGDVIGTMRYMSPEQARGQSALIDGRADVYSLAATLYEMLTLQPATPGDDAPTILKMIDTHEVTPLRVLRPDLPRDLETVIAKAMSKSREARYETAEQFSADLQRVLADEPTLARPATIADRIGRMASKHRSVVLTGAAIVALGFVGSAIATAKLAAAKQVSDASGARALRGEKLARDAVDRLGSQMAELLSDIPAADSVRRQLLIETLDYYERFAAEVKSDPALREDLAITLGKTGALQSELGDHESAIATLGRSEAIYAELARQPTASDSILLDWSKSQNNLAQTLVRSGRFEDAAKYFARAIVTQKSVAGRSSVRGSSTGMVMATTLNNLGLLLSQTGATEQAEQTYLEAIDLLRGLPPVPDAAASERPAAILANVQANLSGLLTEQSPERAVEYAREALAGQLDALQADRGNAKLATQTVVMLNTLGAAQFAGNDSEGAIDTFNRAVEIGKQMLARWPNQPTYRRDLVLSYNHLGLALSKNAQVAKAQVALDEAISLGRPLAQTFANDAEIQSMVGRVLNNFGFLNQQLGDQESAASAYAEAIEHQSAAVRLAPEVQQYSEFLRKHRANLSSLDGVDDVSDVQEKRDSISARLLGETSS